MVTPAGSSTPPAWARVLDLLCVGLTILAGIAFLWGGFRVRLAGVRLSVTSPYRLLLWAAAVGLVRHVAAPAIPIYRDFPPRIRAWQRQARSAGLIVPDVVPGSDGPGQLGGRSLVGAEPVRVEHPWVAYHVEHYGAAVVVRVHRVKDVARLDVEPGHVVRATVAFE